jgi:hypothetical protein
MTGEDSRDEEALRLAGLDGMALRRMLGERVWTTSGKTWLPALFLWLSGVTIIGAAGAVLLRAFALAVGDRPNWWVPVAAVLVSTALVVVSLVFVFKMLNAPWVRLDPSGITCGGARGLRLSPAPKTHAWTDCGPFEVRYDFWSSFLSDDDLSARQAPRFQAQCDLKTGKLTLKPAFGAPADLVTILNAYRKEYGHNASHDGEAAA